MLILYNSDNYWEIDGRTLLLRSVDETPSLFDEDFDSTPDSVFNIDNTIHIIQIAACFKDQFYVLKYNNGKFYNHKRWLFPLSVLRGPYPWKINAALRNFRYNTIFLFQGSKFYSCQRDKCLNNSSIEVNNNISTKWPGIPKDISAAVHLPNHRKYYFFKGDMYWSFDEDLAQVETGYPRNVSQLLCKWTL